MTHLLMQETSCYGLIHLLFVFSLTGTALMFVSLAGMTDDGRVVNYAGIVRGGTQRLIKLELAGKPSDELIANLDKIITGLSEGSKELNLPKVTDERFTSKLNELKTKWASLKNLIKNFRQDKTLSGKLLEDSEDYFKLTNEVVFAAENYSRKKVVTSKVIQITIFAVNVALLALIFIMTQKKIIKPIYNFSNLIERVSKDDLTTKVETKGKDEISQLGSHLNGMVQSFSGIIDKILQTVVGVIDSTDKLRERAERASDGSRNQSSQASQIATAAEEMSQTITDIAKNASQAAESAEEAMKTASEGKALSNDAIKVVEEVYQSTAELSQVVQSLNRRAEEIGEIVTVIKDIADQTNLLALNAAIEAARAGEQGRGFAVVADEVRKLAERTIKATDEISEKIRNIQNEAEATSRSMDISLKNVTKANEFIKELGNSLLHIVDSVNRVKDQITQIATAVDEQSAASEEVAKNIEKTSEIAKEMERIASEVMTSVNELTKIVEDLRNATSGFKTEASRFLVIDLAKTDHRVFVGKIGACLTGSLSLSAEQLPDHRNCRFGKWYLDEGQRLCGHLASFKAIDEPHARIHSLAKEAISACNRGDTKRAEELYRQIETLSHNLVNLLDNLKRDCQQNMRV
ncbi:methyl-accepting chemotaxis protein [Thermodesulfovibrio sp. 3907-1M]|uniref:Methyl-accepting chemotaxis protein n=1 Tax=Thermodesulfovibrio autotrophicus TaxID=3118333 RepID=A0AAU8H0F6_9BACT